MFDVAIRNERFPASVAYSLDGTRVLAGYTHNVAGSVQYFGLNADCRFVARHLAPGGATRDPVPFGVFRGRQGTERLEGDILGKRGLRIITCPSSGYCSSVISQSSSELLVGHPAPTPSPSTATVSYSHRPLHPFRSKSQHPAVTSFRLLLLLAAPPPSRQPGRLEPSSPAASCRVECRRWTTRTARCRRRQRWTTEPSYGPTARRYGWCG